MNLIDHSVLNKSTKNIPFKLTLDRLSICYDESNAESVKKTVGLLLSDHITKLIPGMQVTKNGRYAASCRIPFPVNTNSIKHTICFEAGPHRAGQAAFRLDCNPSKLSSEGLNDLIAHLAGWINADDICFFYFGRSRAVILRLIFPPIN